MAWPSLPRNATLPSVITEDRIAEVQARVQGVNPADLTRQINQIQTRLTAAARAKTDKLATAGTLDLEPLQASINRLTPTNRKPSLADPTRGTTNPHELTHT